MLQFDLQTLFIIHAIFVEMLDLLNSFYDEFLRLYTLTFASLDASGTVDGGFTAAVLIEIFQTDNHQLIQMINNSNNIVKKSYACQSNRNFTVALIKPLQIVRTRKRSRSVSSISSKQSSMQGQLQKKINYKLSREHVILLIQEERMRDQEIIQGSDCLSLYYTCFNNLFKIIYLSAQTTIKHSFYKREEELNFDKLQIIGSLIGEFEGGWPPSKSSKLIILSQNIYQLSRSLADFQRRMQYVCRKVCMNKSKKAAIQNAFLNPILKKSWQNILKNDQFIQYNEFLLDMFENDAEKLCYLDIRRFTNKCLCRPEFRDLILRCCKKEEIDQQMDVSFTFEFFLIEEFCLGEEFQVSEPKPKAEKQQNKCFIM